MIDLLPQPHMPRLHINTWNVASVNEDLNFKFGLFKKVLHVIVAILLDSTALELYGHRKEKLLQFEFVYIFKRNMIKINKAF